MKGIRKFEYQKKAEETLRKDIIDAIYNEIDTGYAKGNETFYFYQEEFSVITKIPKSARYYSIFKTEDGYDVIDKNDDSCGFVISKYEANGFALDDIIKMVSDNLGEQYVMNTMTNETYLEIKLENIQDEFAREIRDIKSDISLLNNWKSGFCVDYNLLSDKVYKIGKSKRKLLKMLIISVAVILLCFPIIKLLILINS